MKNFNAIHAMYPDAAFSMVDDDISTIQWRTEGIVTPSQAQIDAKIAELDALEAQNQLNKETAKAAAEAKVAALGLTIDDIKALLQ